MAMIRIGLLAMLLAFTSALPSRAAEPLYEGQLLRLSEILGSLHFLRTLCGENGDAWRGEMETLLVAENPPPDRKAKLVASFNRGYRSFGGVYKSCTESATTSIARYMKEGEALSREIASRFGN